MLALAVTLKRARARVPCAALRPSASRRCLSAAAGAPAGAASSFVGDHMKEAIGLPAGARTFALPRSFELERGGGGGGLALALGYTTYGALNAAGDNAVLVGHSLTSNSHVHEWWGPLLGAGPAFALDTSRFFVVCANYLGSVYGSTGPASPAPPPAPPGATLGPDFPVVSVRDNARAARCLLDALGVRRLALSVGGSLGGMLALEAAASFPGYVDRMLLVATVARHTDWAIGWGEAGRRAVFADAAWAGGRYAPGAGPRAGLAAARALAMLSYRTPASFSEKFNRARAPAGAPRAPAMGEPAEHFDVEAYLHHQGEKFVRRFDAGAYVRLTQLMDTHDIGRGRAGGGGGAGARRGGGGDDDDAAYRRVLRGMTPRASLVVGIDSDLLYPLPLQEELARELRGATLHVIRSPHGHDAFLINIDELNRVAAAWVAAG